MNLVAKVRPEAINTQDESGATTAASRNVSTLEKQSFIIIIAWCLTETIDIYQKYGHYNMLKKMSRAAIGTVQTVVTTGHDDIVPYPSMFL